VPWLIGSKKRNMRVAAFFYGAWCIFWIVTAAFGIGEAREGAHLALAITGIPIALASLYLPHASMLGILVAAAAGLIQWVLFTGWISGEPPVKLSTDQDEPDDL
jgi:hypothetical protein